MPKNLCTFSSHHEFFDMFSLSIHFELHSVCEIVVKSSTRSIHFTAGWGSFTVSSCSCSLGHSTLLWVHDSSALANNRPPNGQLLAYFPFLSLLHSMHNWQRKEFNIESLVSTQLHSTKSPAIWLAQILYLASWEISNESYKDSILPLTHPQ